MKPAVSFVMPLLNGVTYLRTAIDSLLSQTFHNFEVIVVDDGSTDGSLELLTSIDDKRIRLLRNAPARGISASLNEGILRAEGDFIARMDADDISVPERLSVQIDFLNAHQHIAVCGSWARQIDAGGAELGLRRTPVGRQMAFQFWKPSPLIHPSVVARRSVFQTFTYDPTLRCAEDYDLWLRVRTRFALDNIPEFLLLYRIHQNCATFTGPDQDLRTTYDVFQRHCSDRISYEVFCSIVREDYTLSVPTRVRTSFTLARSLRVPYRAFLADDWRYCRRRLRQLLRKHLRLQAKQ
jgi:glycosyltransferase involved in cell wall biosynthesis